jgi:low temperature requirement protein LtrA
LTLEAATRALNPKMASVAGPATRLASRRCRSAAISEAQPAARHGLLRERSERPADVRPIELFFDLVYVLAITQLTRQLAEHLTVKGAGETLLLLLAVWGAWNHTSWVTNYFDPDARPVRLMLLAVMLASLIMSSSLPDAFAGGGLRFAAAFVAIQVGRTLFALVALEHDHPRSPVFRRALAWWLLTGLIWLGGGLAHGNFRVAIWVIAAIGEYGGVWLGFPVPGLGRSSTTDYTIAGEHMAERCHGFVIIALGESIVLTGANFGQLPSTAATAAAFAVAFIGTVAFWWVYFDRTAEAGRRVIAAASDPGRLGVSAYTYEGGTAHSMSRRPRRSLLRVAKKVARKSAGAAQALASAALST